MKMNNSRTEFNKSSCLNFYSLDIPTVLLLAILFSSLLKALFAVMTIGTGDILDLSKAFTYIASGNLASIYTDLPFKYPPAVAALVFIVGKVSLLFGGGAAFFLRLPGIIADSLGAILIYRIMRSLLGEKVALKTALVFALNPVMFFINGFHGTFSSIAWLMLFFALYFIVAVPSMARAALFLGLAFNFDFFTFITFPAFLIFMRKRNFTRGLLAIVAGVLFFGYGFHLFNDFSGLTKNLWNPGKYAGFWGVVQILIFHQGVSFAEAITPFLKIICFIGLVAAPHLFLKSFCVKEPGQKLSLSAFFHAEHLCRGLLFSAAFCILLSSRFDISFLVGLSWLIVFAGTKNALIFNILGGSFVFGVYTLWSGGFPWSLVDSGDGWGGLVAVNGLALWLFIFFLVYDILIRFFRENQNVSYEPTLRLILKITMLFACLAIYVPFTPRMPGPSLDESWMFGINQAVAQGLAFGSEIIFTYGPLASVATGLYHPATDFIMLAGCLLIAVAHWLCFSVLQNGARLCWGYIFLVYLLTTVFLRESLLLAYPLLLSAALIKIGGDLENDTATPSTALICFIFLPLGLLSLVKATILISAVLVVAAGICVFMMRGNLRMAAACFLSPLSAFLFFWSATGQNFSNLYYYMVSLYHIITGYTEAMSIGGRPEEIFFFLLSSVFLLLSVASVRSGSYRLRALNVLLHMFFILLFFKSAFVRHDSIHVIISFNALFQTALIIAFLSDSKLVRFSVILSLSLCIAITNSYMHLSPSKLLYNALQKIFSADSGLKNRICVRGWLEDTFNKRLTDLQTIEKFPALNGRSDVYSTGQSYLLASGNKWTPRPVLQSYSSYTGYLIDINYKHLLGENSPENIFFQVGPIDHRLPSLEDGISWSVIFQNYRFAGFSGGHALLSRHSLEPVKFSRVAAGQSIIGAWIEVPEAAFPVFLRLEIVPTFLGKLFSLVFKPEYLFIKVRFLSGKEEKYRIVAKMVASNFLISPFVRDTEDFVGILQNQTFSGAEKVKAIKIETSGSGSTWLKNVYFHFDKVVK